MVDSVLVEPQDLEGVRTLLGSTEIDATDEVIQSVIYDGAITLRVYQRLGASRWTAIDDDPDGTDDRRVMRRLAVVNYIAGSIAETKAKGGMLGNVYPMGGSRDWNQTASELMGQGDYWVGRLLDTATDIPETDAGMYDLTGSLFASARRRSWRRHGTPQNSAWSWTSGTPIGVPYGWYPY